MKKGLLLIAAIIFIAFSANAQAIFTDDFQDDDISDWLTVTPTYASANFSWHIASYDGAIYLSAAAFDGSDHASTQWIVSPSFDANGKNSITVEFDNRMRYTPANPLQLFVSTDFAGDSASFDAATWVEITGFDLDSDASDYDWEEGVSGTASIVGSANTYIAFKYVSPDAGGGNWTFDNVVVTTALSVGNVTTSTKLYPNPATSVLNIKSEVSINNITVANVIGQTVLNVNNINANNHTLELDALTNGVYLININNVDGTSSVAKFVKK